MDNLYINKVLSGDSNAFRYFVSTYKDMAFSIALSVVKQEDAAEDVVQESFIQVYLALSSFKGDSKFSTWLYKIVVRCSFKYLKVNTLQTVPLNVGKHDLFCEDSLAVNILDKERKQIINDLLRKISSNESLILRLFYLEELAIKEIIQITGWSISKVKVTLYRARKSMHCEIKKILKEEDDGTY